MITHLKETHRPSSLLNEEYFALGFTEATRISHQLKDFFEKKGMGVPAYMRIDMYVSMKDKRGYISELEMFEPYLMFYEHE